MDLTQNIQKQEIILNTNVNVALVFKVTWKDCSVILYYIQILNQHFFNSRIHYQIYLILVGDSIHVYLMSTLSETLPTAMNKKTTTF
jgi:hypothetical protein